MALTGPGPTRRKHRLNILPRHGVERTPARRVASIAWRRAPRSRRLTSQPMRCPGCTARSRAAWSSGSRRCAPSRAASSNGGPVPAAATIVASRRLSACRARRRRSRRRVGGAPACGGTPPVVVVRRGRRRSSSTKRRATPRSAALSSSGPTWRCTSSSTRRRCSRAGTRCSRSTASPCSRASGPARCASCAISTALKAGRRRRPATSTCTTSATCWSTPASPIRSSTRRRITLRWTQRRGAACRAAPARRQHRARIAFAGLRTRAWRERLLAALGERADCGRQHRPQRRSRLRSWLQARATTARRRAGRCLARRNAGDGAPPPAFVLRRCAKICRFVEASRPSMRLRSLLAAAAGFSRPFRRQQDVSSQLPGISRARSRRVVASLRQLRGSRRQLGAMAAASQLLDDADPAGRLLPLALRLVAGDRRRVLVARRDAGLAVRRDRDPRGRRGAPGVRAPRWRPRARDPHVRPPQTSNARSAGAPIRSISRRRGSGSSRPMATAR